MNPKRMTRVPSLSSCIGGLAALLGVLILLVACVADEGDAGDFRVCRNTCTEKACLDGELWCYDECGNAHHRVAVCLDGCEEGACLDPDGDLEQEEDAPLKPLFEPCTSSRECESGWCYPTPKDPAVRFCTTACRVDTCTNLETNACQPASGARVVEPDDGCGLGTCCYVLDIEETVRDGCGTSRDSYRFFGICAYPSFTR